jgi:hypothetical protein
MIRWIKEVISFAWIILGFLGVLFFWASLLIKRQKTEPLREPLILYHSKYNQLEEAYNFMKGSAIFLFIALFLLWLLVRKLLYEVP